MASEMENTLLSQLPAFSRIVTPDATIYIKQGDGIWYRWANFKYDCAVQLGQFLPTGTQAFHMQDDTPRYVKYCHDWLTTRPDRAVFASNSEHSWCHTSNCVLIQAVTVVKVIKEMLHGNSNTGALFPGSMMEMGGQYIYLSAASTATYSPTFYAEPMIETKGMDELATRMEDAYITPHLHSADI
ncbi:hypothetical protein V8D89_002621 [Ganoderma adspersum]